MHGLAPGPLGGSAGPGSCQPDMQPEVQCCRPAAVLCPSQAQAKATVPSMGRAVTFIA